MNNIFSKKEKIVKESVNFNFQDLSHDIFEEFTFNDCSFIGANLEAVQFKDCIFNDCTFFGCDLIFSKINNSKFFNCNFSKIDASNSTINSYFNNCTFNKATLLDINFKNSKVKNCNFDNANFAGAFMQNFTCKFSTFCDASFFNASIPSNKSFTDLLSEDAFSGKESMTFFKF